MPYRITVMPQKQNIEAAAGENLLHVLRAGGFPVNAVCGGNGSCGKCMVRIDGQEKLACHTVIDRDMTVTLSLAEDTHTLIDSITQPATSCKGGFHLAFDIGTTTVAGYLLNGESGQELVNESALNPQISYGADVISRIQHALRGHMEELIGPV